MGKGVLRGESGTVDPPPKTYILALMSPRRANICEGEFSTKVQEDTVGLKETEVLPESCSEDQKLQKLQGDSSHSLDANLVGAVALEKERDDIKVIDVEKEEHTPKCEKSKVLSPSTWPRRITRSESKRLSGSLEITPSKDLEHFSTDLQAAFTSAEVELKPHEKLKASRPLVMPNRITPSKDCESFSTDLLPDFLTTEVELKLHEKLKVSRPPILPKRITRSEFKRLNGGLDTFQSKVREHPLRETAVHPCSIELESEPYSSVPIPFLKRRRLNHNDNTMKTEPDGSGITDSGILKSDGEAKTMRTDSVKNPSSTEDSLILSPGVGMDHGNLQAGTKELELKMSNKISLSKFPKTIEDLLATGLLDGCKVKYLHNEAQKEDLHGVVEDGTIICFCSSCKGKQTVSPVQFELHAGSVKKRAIDFIYLENGKAICDILRSCVGTPLVMLKETMQAEIHSSGSVDITTNGTSPQLFEDSMNLQQTPVRRHSPRFPNSPITPKSSCILPADKALPRKSAPAKLTRKFPNSPITPKSSCILLADKALPRKSVPAKLTRKDLGLHKLVFMSKGLPDGTEVAYYSCGQRLLEGYKQGFGIFCYCCKTEVSPSQFEAHAGWGSRRKPYLHIYTSDGVSLHELSVSLTKVQKKAASDNDDLCTICGDGGDLLLCDGCPRAFHPECVDLTCIPRGKWYCSYCERNFEEERTVAQNQNALSAGRVLGVEALEKLRRRCTRVVKKPHVEVGGGCVLCRGHDFRKSGFGHRTVMLCDQCEREFHVGCLRDHGLVDLKELPKGKWFCCTDCSRIYISLEKLVLRGAEKLPPSLSEVIKKKPEEKGSDGDADCDICWSLLSGRSASPDSRLLLSKAVAIFQDCFDPIIDTATGRDLIPAMVYGRNTKSQEFGGIYCAVLTVNSTVVSAGVLRIFGKEVAELPLVATSSGNQGMGYFQALFSCIERFLGFLEVKNLVLPAADDVESIWTKKFGFSKMRQDEVSNYNRDVKMMSFHGTSMLQKPVPKCRIITRPKDVSPGPMLDDTKPS